MSAEHEVILEASDLARIGSARVRGRAVANLLAVMGDDSCVRIDATHCARVERGPTLAFWCAALTNVATWRHTQAVIIRPIDGDAAIILRAALDEALKHAPPIGGKEAA